jgi:hypothetical protein
MRTGSSPSRLDARRHAQDAASVGLMLGFTGAVLAVFFLLLAVIGIAFLVYMLFVVDQYYH